MASNLKTKPAVHTVRLEPVGIEMEVEEGETVLEAAFRQGIALMHGCKEGQCASCKSLLLDGDIELKKYSTFALSDMERESNHVLLCRTLAFSDLEVELLNFDEELLKHSIPVKDYAGRITAVEALTHDIRRLVVAIDQPLRFHAGQYVDITVPDRDLTRSFSMANAPSEGSELEFIIKRYPEGAFSSLLDGGLEVGTALELRGPYGTCFRREGRSGPMLLIGGGSGMSPLWSILGDQIEADPTRPIRFFYGARRPQDLFWQDRFEALTQRLEDFRFIPALSALEEGDAWAGEQGFVHDVLRAHLKELADLETADAYSCGPPPMIDATLPVLQMAGLEPEHIHFDKFTPALR